MTANKAIDRKAIEAMLESTGDDPGFVAEIIGDYLEDALVRLEELSVAVANTDAAGARQAAHTLKGSSASFGAIQLSILAAEAERLSQRSDIEPVGELMPALRTELDRVQDALHAEQSRLLGTSS